jgi:predicted Holliday junction resolvase-like endonuclease
MTDAIELAKQSDSTIIILIIVLVLSILALIPVIKIIGKHTIKLKQMEIEQQDKILTALTANTDVNASLKTVLEDDRKKCDKCRTDQLRMFKDLQDNQDIANMKLVEIHTILKKDSK